MKRTKMHRFSVILALGAVFFAVYFIFAMAGLKSDIREKRLEGAEISIRYDNEKEKNDDLRRLLESGSEAELMERIARENRGYVYLGERVYFDVTPGE